MMGLGNPLCLSIIKVVMGFCRREAVGIDRGAVEGSDGYSGDGHGGNGSSWWGEILGMLKFISFQQCLCML